MSDTIRKIVARLRGQPTPAELLAMMKRNGLTVGKNFHMLGGCIIDWDHCWHITIGDDVTLAPRVHILAHDASTKMHLGYTRIGKVKIGDRVFIGASAIVLPGVTIGSDVVIGAGSVVAHDIPDNGVATGSPAKVRDTLTNFLARRAGEMDRTPRFGSEYTLDGGVTAAMRDEMNRRMDRTGYVM